MSRIVVAVASNSEAILNSNLGFSPLFKSGTTLHVERNAPSAAMAYNRALDATTEPYVVYAHHDVYLPRGWEKVLAARVTEIETLDPNWAVLGAYGVGVNGAHSGPVWSTSLGQILGRIHLEPLPVQSFDELLIVLRRDSGLRFDDGLPGWHFYGTDIAQIARSAGKGAYATPLPCIHNDRFHESLGVDFGDCYRYMKRKWASRLPLYSPVIRLSWHGLDLRKVMRNDRGSVDVRKGLAMDNQVDPRLYAARCGWTNLDPESKSE